MIALTKMDPTLKKICFDYPLLSPGDWYIQALALKAAANRLDHTKFPIRQDEDTINHVGSYQMLLSFSFENLIKGLVVFFRLRQGDTETLVSKHFTHDLGALACDPCCAPLKITPHELATLKRLSAYGIWAGRYPRPMREVDVIVKSYGSREYTAEKILWDRLSIYLYNRGWIKKWVDKTRYSTILMLKEPDANCIDENN
ncbi:MAG: hypothetical protein H7240_10665 [Glaciimonas sp.]|nr:hypothetical protein [Glaciimonas sp.]